MNTNKLFYTRAGWWNVMHSTDDLLPIYERPSILLPLLGFSVWALIVSYRLDRMTSAQRPGFLGRIVISPMAIWVIFIMVGIQPILLGLFPDIGWIPSGSMLVLAGTSAYFDVGPPFVMRAEAQYRNKFGMFYETSPTLKMWSVKRLVPFLLAHIDAVT